MRLSGSGDGVSGRFPGTKRALSVSLQYDPAFVNAGIDVAPLTMPARPEPFEFPALGREAFKGLPGMLADALPDRFGNRLIDAWLAQTGRSPETFNPVDRLCYVGRRGMGALEFEPALRRRTRVKNLEADRLADLAGRVLEERSHLAGRLDGDDDTGGLRISWVLVHRRAVRAPRRFLPGTRKPGNSDPDSWMPGRA